MIYLHESCIQFSVVKPPNVVAHQWPEVIIIFWYPQVEPAEACFSLAYGVTGGKQEECKHYKIATALRIYKSRIKFKERKQLKVNNIYM